MFVQHKQLKQLNVAAEKISHLHASSSSVQLAFAGFAPQLCSAYLCQIESAKKALIVVSFYLKESQTSIFFVPKFGEVEKIDAGNVYEEGYSFIESMGFILTETDYHLLPLNKKDNYWKALPICQQPKSLDSQSTKPAANNQGLTKVHDGELQTLRVRSLESLGRFLASM